jgi:serine acetyltransferase
MSTHYFAEKNSPSDEELYIHELHVKSGEMVKSGDVLISAEGAKALFDIEMPEDGYVTFHVTSGTVVPIGSKLFSISQTNSSDLADTVHTNSIDTSIVNQDVAHPRFSKMAMELVIRYNLDLGLFEELEFVTSDDVKARLSSSVTQLTNGRLISEFSAVALIGGGMGAEVILERLKLSSQIDKISGYFDLTQKTNFSEISYFGAPEREAINSAFTKGDFEGLLITVTSNMKFRRQILEIVESLEIPLATFIDQGAFVANSAIVGSGSIVLDSARVGHKAQLGKNVFLSGFVNIDHHCVVGDNSTFGPGVFFSGNVKSGKDVVFASNIAVEPGITIGDQCTISSGSILTRDVPSNTIVKTRSTTHFRD